MGPGSSRLVPWGHMLCPGRTSHHGTNISPPTPPPTPVTKITLYFVQRGLAVPHCLSPANLIVPLAAVCMRVRTHACVHFHLFIHCTRYLLSAHYVPGTVAEFLWVFLVMPFLLLLGPFCASFCPQIATSLSVWVSQVLCVLCVFFSPSLPLQGPLCLAFFSLSPVPSYPLLTLGLCRPWVHPWTTPPPAQPISSHRAIFSFERIPMLLSLQGFLSWWPSPGPNLSASSGNRRVGGAPSLLVPDTLESGAPRAAGLHSSHVSRGGKAPCCWKGLVKTQASCLSPLITFTSYCSKKIKSHGHHSKDLKQPLGQGGTGTPWGSYGVCAPFSHPKAQLLSRLFLFL